MQSRLNVYNVVYITLYKLKMILHTKHYRVFTTNYTLDSKLYTVNSTHYEGYYIGYKAQCKFHNTVYTL